MHLQDIIPAGTTSYRGAVLRIIDSTDGTPETGVVYNTSGLDLWYRKIGGARTAITEATLAAVDSAYSSGGIIHIADGTYRLDLPDAALDTEGYADFGGTVTGMVVIGGRIKLASATRGLAGTALPAVAAEASGGLYTRGTGAGQIAQDANGNIRANLDTIKTQTVTCAAGVTVLASVGTAATSTAQTGDSYARIGAAGAGLTGITGVTLAATQTGVTIPTVTTLTNLPAITTNWLTATGIAADAITAAKVAADVTTEIQSGLATAAELAKVPKSDGTSTWNATALASINAEVDTALNTAIPGSPTANSINERVAAIDDLTQASGAGDLAAILVDTGTTLDGKLNTIDDFLDTEVAAILEDTGTTLPATLSTIAGYIDTEVASILAAVDTEIGALTTELAKVPKSDSTVSWNATALAAIQSECNDALVAYDPPTKAEMDSGFDAIPTAVEINAEVVDALNVDTYAEPAQGAPSATTSLAAKIGYIYKAWRNKKTQTSSTWSLFNDDAVTVDHKATVTDDGTTTTKGEIATGP